MLLTEPVQKFSRISPDIPLRYRDKGTVQRIEAGKRSVSREEINAIAKVLKTTPEAFSTDEGSDE